MVKKMAEWTWECGTAETPGGKPNKTPGIGKTVVEVDRNAILGLMRQRQGQSRSRWFTVRELSDSSIPPLNTLGIVRALEELIRSCLVERRPHRWLEGEYNSREHEYRLLTSETTMGEEETLP